MYLALFGFLPLSLLDIVDILIVASIIFILFTKLRGSSAWSIFLAILALFFLRVASAALGMKLTSRIMDTVLNVGVLALIVIFQPEIRRMLSHLGKRTMEQGFFARLIKNSNQSGVDSDDINELAEACRRMSESKTGALIVIPHHDALDEIIETGDRIDAAIHRRLIMNIFFKNSPLHDGAMIIRDGHITAARCTLPITQKTNIPPSYGMRHKAAIGITEDTDAETIVVSEETGNIAFVSGGNVVNISNINELKLLLNNSFAK